jgi:hypothetical protein
MQNVPVIPQFGNAPVMYRIILYRNMYLYRNMPALIICIIIVIVIQSWLRVKELMAQRTDTVFVCFVCTSYPSLILS